MTVLHIDLVCLCMSVSVCRVFLDQRLMMKDDLIIFLYFVCMVVYNCMILFACTKGNHK